MCRPVSPAVEIVPSPALAHVIRLASAAALVLASCALPNLPATVRANADMVVGAFVDVTVPKGATSVQVTYGSGQTPQMPTNGASTLTVAVAGLQANATNHLVAKAFKGSTAVAVSHDLPLATGALPDLPQFNVTTGDPKMPGYLAVSIIDTYSQPGYAIIIDRSGAVQWYHQLRNPGEYGFDFQRQPNGHFTLFQGDTNDYEEMDISGTVLHRWSAPGATLGTDGHDIVLLPNGNALMVGRTSHMADTRPYTSNGVANAVILDAVVEEVDPNGNAVFHWSSDPEVTLDEIPTNNWMLATEANGDVDAVHPDSLSVAPDGNILLGCYTTSNVIKIDRMSAMIDWRLGGVKSDFQFVNDPLDGMDHEHFIRYIPNGDILAMDDGFNHTPQESRAVEYTLNETAFTATFAWQFRHVPPLWILAGGSAAREANGNTTISWSDEMTITEVNAAGDVTWEMAESPWFGLYRALPLETLYP